MRKSLPLLAIAALAAATALAGAQGNDRPSIGMLVSPDVAFPIGGKAEYYQTGYGGRLAALLRYGRLDWLSPRLDLSYSYVPLSTESTTSLSLIRGSAGVQGTLLFGERLAVFGYGGIGAYFGSLGGSSASTGGFMSYHGGVGVGFQPLPDVALNLGAELNSWFGTFDAFSVFLGLTTRLTGPGGGAIPLASIAPLRPGALPASGLLRISDVKLDTVFPVLWKYYDAHPVGRAVVTNTSRETLSNVEVRVHPASFADQPKLSARIPELRPGDSREVDLYILFNDTILSVSEGAKVVTDITTAYRVGQRDGADKETVTLETYDRNALQWDDDRKIAAFVTAKDDEIQRFAKGMASLLEEAPIDAISLQVRQAILLHSAIVEQGVAYVVDPSSSYERLSDSPQAIDYVQFPRQTLYVRAGDCDDLSATLCALLEAVGVPTAFVTVPGHIYMAFRANVQASEAGRFFSDQGELITRPDGSIWIPVETTVLGGGFLQAWAEGARQWRKHSGEGNATFFTTAEAWSTYQPVAFSVSQIELGIPLRDGVFRRFREQLDGLVAREMYPREKVLLERLASRPDDPGIINSLAVLYGRYGRYDEAKQRLEQVLQRRPYLPALVNLANVQFLTRDYRQARRRYEDALALDPANAAALLGLARTEYELGNFGSVRQPYGELARLSPDLAQRFAYLGSGGDSAGAGRASSAGEHRTRVVWEEDR